MTKEQAKIILQSCRPGAEDDPDPLVAEALAWAQRDPELRAWWQAECAVDVAIRRKLKRTTVPANLAQRIVATQRERHRAAGLRYLALAAVLVLLGVTVSLFLPRGTPKSQTEFMTFREDMAQFLKVFPRLDFETEKVAQARQWLAQKPWLTAPEFPMSLERFPTIGCREIQWRGKRAALVCFMVDGEVIHLFMLPGSSFSSFPAQQPPEFNQDSEMTTAAWRRGDTIYLAVTKGKRPFLERHLTS